MAQIRLADIVGKTIQTCFVPADGKAVTFVLEEGRMSLGAPKVWLGFLGWDGPIVTEGAKITEPPSGDPWHGLFIITDRGTIIVHYEGAESLTELPE